MNNFIWSNLLLVTVNSLIVTRKVSKRRSIIFLVVINELTVEALVLVLEECFVYITGAGQLHL